MGRRILGQDSHLRRQCRSYYHIRYVNLTFLLLLLLVISTTTCFSRRYSTCLLSSGSSEALSGAHYTATVYEGVKVIQSGRLEAFRGALFTGAAPTVQWAVKRVGPFDALRLDTVVSPRTQQYWMHMQATLPSLINTCGSVAGAALKHSSGACVTRCSYRSWYQATAGAAI